jgi:hypothetical protein
MIEVYLLGKTRWEWDGKETYTCGGRWMYEGTLLDMGAVPEEPKKIEPLKKTHHQPFPTEDPNGYDSYDQGWMGFGDKINELAAAVNTLNERKI